MFVVVAGDPSVLVRDCTVHVRTTDAITQQRLPKMVGFPVRMAHVRRTSQGNGEGTTEKQYASILRAHLPSLQLPWRV
jgi:hypothetical protein